MRNKYLISFVVSFLLLWSICVVFNSTVVVGKVVLAKAFISPMFTLTTAAQYMHLGMGLSSGLAYVLATLLLLFLWFSFYLFVISLLRAIEVRGSRER